MSKNARENTLIIKVHLQQNFKDTKNDSRDSIGNLDSMSVSLANKAKLAFFNNKYPDIEIFSLGHECSKLCAQNAT